MGRAGKPEKEAPGMPGDFLVRWSRRKMQAREGNALPEDPEAAPALPPETATDPPQARRPEQELTDADMPPVETLNADSDFAPFMSPGVSDGLRQRALRILFSQPACNITDGLDDYDGDYTQFAGLGKRVTHEMKRMLKRELEAEIKRQQEAAAQAQESRPADADVPVEPEQPAARGQLDEDADDAAGRV